MLLQKGYVRNDDDFEEVKLFFKGALPEYDIKKLGIIEKLYLYKAYLWYSFIVQDFVSSYRYAQKWVDLFMDHPEMKRTNPVFYLKGINYLLESLFLIQYLTKFKSTLEYFERELQEEKFLLNENTESLTFLYLYLNKLNLYFLEGNFNRGLSLIPEVLSKLEEYRSKVDEHHVMVFYYKLGSLYFGSGQYDKCIYYLELIIKNKQLGIREDLMCFARILNLVAHYEAGMDQNLEALIKSTYKFLIKMNELHEVQKKFINFLRNLSKIYPHELKNAFRDLHAELKEFEDHPYEKRSFIYLDIISWLESKINNVSVESIIKQKSKRLYK
jgi:tetratricopeptide (TPR) repeat protein